MSIKVYEAYRVKPEVAGDLKVFWAWARTTQGRAAENVKASIRGMMETVMSVPPEDDEMLVNFMAHYGYGKARARVEYAQKVLRDEEKNQRTSPYRNPFDFSVSITIREFEGSLYIIPSAGLGAPKALDFLCEDPALEDFAYWNNTDPPPGHRKGAGYERWKARERVWLGIDEQIDKCLVLHACDFQLFSSLLFPVWEALAREANAKDKGQS